MARLDVVPWSMARTYFGMAAFPRQATCLQPSGFSTRLLLAGYFSSMRAGRMGRCTRLPPQLGQLPASTPMAQSRQKVHSKVQIMAVLLRSEEHTSELQSLMRISYAVFCWKKNIKVKHL